MNHRAVAVACLLGLCLVAGAGSARAGTGIDHHWSCVGGGAFTDDACWMEGTVPGSSDSAIFDLGGAYTVAFPLGGDTLQRAIYRSGIVTMDFGPDGFLSLNNNSSALPGLIVGAGGSSVATVFVTSGRLNGSVTHCGEMPGDLGIIEIEGPDSTIWSFNELHVGHAGFGMLTISGGTEPSIGNVLGNNAGVTVAAEVGSWGALEITGAGTPAFGGDVTVGRNGIGSLTADGGCVVSLDGLVVAERLDALGTVSVAGPGTDVLFDGDATVAVFGVGELSIRDGALVTVTGTMTLGALAEIVNPDPIAWRLSEGEARIEGAASRLVVGGDLEIGMAGRGRMILDGGATVDVAGDLIRGDPPGLAVAADNRIELNLTSAADYPAPAVTVGGLSDPFTVRVELLGGYAPAHGDAFHIISTALGAGDMTFELPELAATLAWEIDQTTTDVVIRVVPGIPGDANGDGLVTIDDIVEVVTNFGPCPTPPALCPGDVNGDGAVTVDDIVIVVLNLTP